MPIKELAKTYDPKTVERRMYDWWESQGYFKPEIAPPDAAPFVISIPPPNVTGELHLGHAMFVALEDLMIRYHRMVGDAALWVPGEDHAGIATQLQVEKALREAGTSRQAIGREKFEARAWEWKNKYGGRIVEQLRRLGASCDWQRERFTLDEGLSRAVREAFVRLWDMGLIYRGEYIINWSPGLQTAVSDLEVEYSEEDGTLYYFNYPVAGKDEVIPVATTRPETILGDTAVCVHPDDERYRHLIGETMLVPIIKRPIPVIHDTYVDRAFGTGALKITPGHDPNDFVIGQRHGLPIINVMNPDATMNVNAGPYAGLDRFECRKRLWADMQAAGLTIKTEPYRLTVPRSQRGGEIIEPMVSNQWFVKMRPMAELGLEAVRRGRITVIPERFEKVYYNWLENIRDWCISRQLWWGHRIPAWYAPDGTIFVARSEEDAYVQARRRLGADVTLRQEEDVLDTWFSSGLWPFSTLGWPDDTADLRRFYPTQVMETGYDILFFWVARMIMSGLLFTNEPPFHTVYLHGLVRDEQGRKMSKTLGNVVDPIQVMDEYGTDALRFTLLTGSTPGNDMNLSLERVAANRNFANKLWNAARFILGNFDALHKSIDTADLGRRALSGANLAEHYTLADGWIRHRLSETITKVTRFYDTYQFGEAGRQVYEFFWDEFADWYLEVAKLELAQGGVSAVACGATLVYVMEQTLRLLHPFIPFVTEEIYQNLKAAEAELQLGLAPSEGWPAALIIAPWPQAGPTYPQAAEQFALLQELIRAIRNMRAEHNVEPARKIAATLQAGEAFTLLQQQAPIIALLARVDPARLQILSAAANGASEEEAGATNVIRGVTVRLPLAGMVDMERERHRLQQEQEKVDTEIQRIQGLLANPNFTGRAPAQVVDRERQRLSGLAEQSQRLAEQLARLVG
ncbi:MAG: valine--tRNA ligase [Chloroflexi bacterium]|nr:valine--tRNA ligase [Chloroflexota bacterium]